MPEASRNLEGGIQDFPGQTLVEHPPPHWRIGVTGTAFILSILPILFSFIRFSYLSTRLFRH